MFMWSSSAMGLPGFARFVDWFALVRVWPGMRVRTVNGSHDPKWEQALCLLRGKKDLVERHLRGGGRWGSESAIS